MSESIACPGRCSTNVRLARRQVIVPAPVGQFVYLISGQEVLGPFMVLALGFSLAELQAPAQTYRSETLHNGRRQEIEIVDEPAPFCSMASPVVSFAYQETWVLVAADGLESYWHLLGETAFFTKDAALDALSERVGVVPESIMPFDDAFPSL